MIANSHRRGRAAHATDAGRPPYVPPARPRTDYWWLTLVSAGLVASANFLAVTGFRLPFLGPAIGFWFLLVYPVFLLYTTSVWHRSSVAERLGYSVTAVLLLLMLGGVAINAALPLLGMQRPLDLIPIVILGDTLIVSLYLIRRRYPVQLAGLGQLKRLRWQESRLLVGSALSVVLAVLGANRLNNGAGDQVSLAALGCLVVTLSLLLRWHRRVRDGMISVTLYLISLALLLMTSLRGWYVTGHDIQTEYRVFQLTAARGHWSIANFHDAYNACLSITILPTEIARIVNVDDPYIYKVFFQILFALCPVLVFEISRRHWSRAISILAAIYFASFPTFLGDMPFLNRQEIAFLFVCVAILSITNTRWEPRQRRFVLFAAAIGVELSHYSTMYILLGTLLVAWMFGGTLRLARWRPSSATAPTDGAPWAMATRTVGIGSLLVVAAILFAWGDLATQTTGPALTTARSAISGLFHPGGARSNSVLYSLLPGKESNPRVLLNGYRRKTLAENAAAPLVYVPASIAARYPTPVINEPALPLTSAGRFLSDIGIPVARLNAAVRQGAAKDEQLFVGVGLIAIFMVRKHRQHIGRELFCLCAGSIVMVTVLTILPNLSVDYGVLRAFQEALILIAPILVVGSFTVFSLFGEVWRLRGAAAVCAAIFISTTGLMPQILGSYPAQLSLNNSGQYYDRYYTRPQEVAAVHWLAGKPGVLPAGLQAPLGASTADRFAFTTPGEVTGQQLVGDIYPSLIQRSSWVILDETAVRTDRASLSIDGDIIDYAYPIGLLQSNKDLVYNNGATEIYK